MKGVAQWAALFGSTGSPERPIDRLRGDGASAFLEAPDGRAGAQIAELVELLEQCLAVRLQRGTAQRDRHGGASRWSV